MRTPLQLLHEGSLHNPQGVTHGWGDKMAGTVSALFFYEIAKQLLNGKLKSWTPNIKKQIRSSCPLFLRCLDTLSHLLQYAFLP